MFVVIEVQDNNEHVGTLSYEYANEGDAYAKFHTILASAAKSDVPYHGASIFCNGNLMRCQAYDHTMTA